MEDKVDILGVSINPLTRAEYRSWLDKHWKSGKQAYITLVNPEFVVSAYYNDNFRNTLNKSFLNIADGIGIIWAGKFLSMSGDNFFSILWDFFVSSYQTAFSHSQLYDSSPLPERIPAIVENYQILESAIFAEKNIYIVGTTTNILKTAISKLQNKYPKINIVGSIDGYQGKEVTANAVRISGADLVIVATGHMRQEIFIAQYLPSWTNTKLAVGVGGWIDQIAGKQAVAPYWIRNAHLEWLYRAIAERRLYRAIWRAIFCFSYLVFREKIRKSKNK